MRLTSTASSSVLALAALACSLPGLALAQHGDTSLAAPAATAAAAGQEEQPQAGRALSIEESWRVADSAEHTGLAIQTGEPIAGAVFANRLASFTLGSNHYNVSVESNSTNTHDCGQFRIGFATVDGEVFAAPVDSLNITVPDIDGTQNQSVRLDIDSFCLKEQQPKNADRIISLELISVTVTQRDPDLDYSTDPTGFTIIWDRFSKSIVAIIDRPTTSPSFDVPFPFVSKSTESSTVGPSETSTVSTSEWLEQLVRQVDEDEKALEQLVYIIAARRKAIEAFIAAQGDNTKHQSDENCSGLKCILRALLRKSKYCLHRIYDGITSIMSKKDEDECSYIASVSPATRVKVLMDPATTCFDEKKRPDTKEYALLDEEDASESDTSSIPDGIEGPQAEGVSDDTSFANRNRRYTIFGVIAVLLCFGGCGGMVVHSRCFNPRAKADRAARCEERRVRREYQQLARRHAIRDWWGRHGIGWGACSCCGGRKQQRSTADYEEKRALILRQEQVLDAAAQEEIRYLRARHLQGVGGDALSAAEQGVAAATTVPLPRHLRPAGPTQRASSGTGPRPARASTSSSVSSTAESLPSYRSRSTRPPSYHERARAVDGSTGVAIAGTATADFEPMTYVADGFRDYRPRQSGDSTTDANSPPTTRSSRSSSILASSDGASDATPDSSIVALSPRGSSDTLRTEHSMGL